RPRSALCPYTTLFRSRAVHLRPGELSQQPALAFWRSGPESEKAETFAAHWTRSQPAQPRLSTRSQLAFQIHTVGQLAKPEKAYRSEEHTSELQSLRHL